MLRDRELNRSGIRYTLQEREFDISCVIGNLIYVAWSRTQHMLRDHQHMLCDHEFDIYFPIGNSIYSHCVIKKSNFAKLLFVVTHECASASRRAPSRFGARRLATTQERCRVLSRLPRFLNTEFKFRLNSMVGWCASWPSHERKRLSDHIFRFHDPRNTAKRLLRHYTGSLCA